MQKKKNQINKNKLYLIVTPEFSNKESITNLLSFVFSRALSPFVYKVDDCCDNGTSYKYSSDN